MKYTQKSFSVGVGERSPEVCAKVGHSTEPDRTEKAIRLWVRMESVGVPMVAHL